MIWHSFLIILVTKENLVQRSPPECILVARDHDRKKKFLEAVVSNYIETALALQFTIIGWAAGLE
jgi:hypothetical protein